MQTATEIAQRPAEPAAAPPMFRLARSKQVIRENYVPKKKD